MLTELLLSRSRVVGAVESWPGPGGPSLHQRLGSGGRHGIRESTRILERNLAVLTWLVWALHHPGYGQAIQVIITIDDPLVGFPAGVVCPSDLHGQTGLHLGIQDLMGALGETYR